MKRIFSCCFGLFLLSLVQNDLFADASQILTTPNGKLAVQISSPSECTWGEMNGVFLDLNEHRSKSVPVEILLGIEALDGSFERYAATAIPKFHREEIKALPAIEFSLPTTQKDTAVAVVLCKDSQKRGTCKNLSPLSLKAVINRHQVQFDKNGKFLSIPLDQTDPAVAPDGIYFYQLALYGPKGIQFPTGSFSEKSLQDFLNTSFEKPLTAGQKQHTRQALQTTRSANLSVEKSHLVVDLPSVDQAKCEQ